MAQYVIEASNWIQDAIEGFRDLRRSMKLRAERKASYKRTLKELSRLTDFELNDIGICRGDIKNIARGDRTIVRGIEVNENLRGSV
jgi:uncharacterized protein YjiS (DUF1127 family)|tara:strand:- start:255 stop:512 length:258 start_codon:yes stop_codon:yes gene_type:complete